MSRLRLPTPSDAMYPRNPAKVSDNTLLTRPGRTTLPWEAHRANRIVMSRVTRYTKYQQLNEDRWLNFIKAVRDAEVEKYEEAKEMWSLEKINGPNGCKLDGWVLPTTSEPINPWPEHMLQEPQLPEPLESESESKPQPQLPQPLQPLAENRKRKNEDVVELASKRAKLEADEEMEGPKQQQQPEQQQPKQGVKRAREDNESAQETPAFTMSAQQSFLSAPLDSSEPEAKKQKLEVYHDEPAPQPAPPQQPESASTQAQPVFSSAASDTTVKTLAYSDNDDDDDAAAAEQEPVPSKAEIEREVWRKYYLDMWFNELKNSNNVQEKVAERKRAAELAGPRTWTRPFWANKKLFCAYDPYHVWDQGEYQKWNRARVWLDDGKPAQRPSLLRHVVNAEP